NQGVWSKAAPTGRRPGPGPRRGVRASGPPGRHASHRVLLVARADQSKHLAEAGAGPGHTGAVVVIRPVALLRTATLRPRIGRARTLGPRRTGSQHERHGHEQWQGSLEQSSHAAAPCTSVVM